ncbi:response regulator [Rugamonas rubra]|uniref:Two-component system, cell cycle response regulator n=1 Tax=Rugamonas rubra TaxID=758825 RepID=A0A1I4JUP7_9BURK|nr:response regulator [Rugamonas rubra]SFL70298.1 two-component system, cell cycle response regulator [Rugamonas rubra]
MARILIIEDNQPNRELLVYLLAAFGHQPLAAVDGEQGLALARAERPDLILCDIQLPGLDGYGVLLALRAHPATRAIPVLASSALAPGELGETTRLAGFDGCLSKSCEPELLLAALQAHLPQELRTAVPAAPAGTATPAGLAPAVASPAPPAGAARLLLLDTAPLNHGLLATILGHVGHTLTVVDSAATAAAARGPFDLLLCDYDPVDAAARGFLAPLLRAHAALPLIVLRPDAGQGIAALLEHHPAPAHLLNHPLDPPLLIEVVAACLAASGAGAAKE